MKYQETAVEIEKEVEKSNESKRIHRFVTLCLYYHVNLCRNNNCSNCKFIMEDRNFFLSNYNQKTFVRSTADKISTIFILCFYF